MTNATRYAIPGARHRVEVAIDRSRFLCTVAEVTSSDDAQGVVRAINVEFPDATHHCWAYVLGAPGSTDRVGLSDDGEPHGTAGRPMLTVLLHSGVGDIGAVVTRWYGGTKLGTGGLVKAYTGAVQLALRDMPRAVRIAYAFLDVQVSYASVSALQLLWPVHEVEVLANQYGTDVRFSLRYPIAGDALLRQAIRDVTRGQVLFTDTSDVKIL